MSLQTRADFPLLEHKIWLASAATGPMSGAALEAVAGTQRALYERFESEAWERDHPAEARAAVAQLIGARVDDVALTRSTSEGLIAVGGAISWRRGDRILITDQEYPANATPWFHLARCHALGVDIVRSDDGRLPASAFARLLGRRTRVVAVSHVQFGSGYRVDLAAIAEQAHEVGALLVVDGIQSVGALSVDMHDLGVDALACGGYKWLCGPLGTGFLYVRREVAEQLVPTGAGFEHLTSPDWKALWGAIRCGGAWVRNCTELTAGAQKFEGIGQSQALLAGQTEAVRYQLRVGVREIEARVLELSGCLADMVEAAGYTLLTPREDGERAGIVLFRGPWDLSGEEGCAALERALRDRGIVVTVRTGGVRASCHHFNDREDLRALMDALATLPTA